MSDKHAIIPRDTDLVPDHVKREQEKFFNEALCFKSLKGYIFSKGIELPYYFKIKHKYTDPVKDGEYFGVYDKEGILLVNVDVWQYGKRVSTIEECNDLDADVLTQATKWEFLNAYNYVTNKHNKISKINNN